MNKKEIVDVIKDKFELRANYTEKIVDAILETITDELAKGETVSLYGFGKFEVKERAARKGFNPATHEAIEIPAKKVVNFKPEKKLKEAVSGEAE